MAAPIDNPDIHLQRLLQPEKPWYQSFVQNIKDAINPPKLPPLEVTSKPVAVEEMWGAYAGNEAKVSYHKASPFSPSFSYRQTAGVSSPRKDQREALLA